MTAHPAPARDVAVIDVGSNSVRLVIYRVEGRAIWTVFNEKVLAGLGRDLGATGRLSVDGVAMVLPALRRFRAVVDGVKPDALFCVATAAVREAADGEAFVQQVRRETGLKIRILSGEEEGRYAALGVVAGSPLDDGLVGDLGGASLELTRLMDGRPIPGVTLPLGPFALGAPAALDIDAVRRRTTDVLEPLVDRFAAPVFHAVGGGWRNIALLHMSRQRYPLHIVHQYDIPARDLLDTTALVVRQSKGSLDKIEGVSKKRVDTLPYAAAVLDVLVRVLRVERVSVSAFGLREGLLFEAMSPKVQALDPLIEGCASLGARKGITETLGPALEAWLAPVFSALPPVFAERDPTLLAAACRLADVGARLHPDHRADLVFEQVLRAPIAGMTHPERGFLALTMFARHTAANTPPEPETLQRVLTADAQRRARALGAAIRLACDLCGRSPALLRKTGLRVIDGELVLSAPAADADLLNGEQIAKRAGAVASALGRKLRLDTGEPRRAAS